MDNIVSTHSPLEDMALKYIFQTDLMDCILPVILL